MSNKDYIALKIVPCTCTKGIRAVVRSMHKMKVIKQEEIGTICENCGMNEINFSKVNEKSNLYVEQLENEINYQNSLFNAQIGM